jgi:predicted lipid carrier protein YhbT
MHTLDKFREALQGGFQVPRFDLPQPIAALNARLPQLPPTLGLTTALNLALERVLPRETLEPLAGKLVSLRVLDAGLTLRFTLTARGFRPAVSSSEPDLSISAKACDFLALALRQEDPDTLFFSRRLIMEGDTDLGLLVKNTLDAVDWPRIELEDLHPFRLFALLRLKLGPSSR